MARREAPVESAGRVTTGLLRWVERRSPSESVALSLVLVGAVASLDEMTGANVAFSVFYLLPVSLTAWQVGRAAGLAMSCLAALAWGYLDWLGGHRPEHAWIYAWNPTVRLGFFTVVTLLLVRLREMYELQVELARTDVLTDAANRRTLVEAVTLEIARSSRTRRPFTLACADLDGFKGVNDRFGHATGDAVLKELVATLRGRTRANDVVARLGGDEFALLMPETGVEEAQRLLADLRGDFEAVARREGWPVGVTVGAVTFAAAPRHADEALALADELLIECKRERKGSIAFAVATAPIGLSVARVPEPHPPSTKAADTAGSSDQKT